VSQWAVFRQEKSPLDAGIWRELEVSRQFSFMTSVVFQAALPGFLLAAVFFDRWTALCEFENQNAAVVQLDFRCLPCRAYSFATFIAEATKVGKAS